MYLMTTMSMSLKRLGTPGMFQPCTRLICRSNIFLSCTLRLCVLVLCSERGVNSVPFKHTCTANTDLSVNRSRKGCCYVQ